MDENLYPNKNMIYANKITTLYSWGVFDRPQKMINSDGSNLAIRNSIIKDHDFINCDFTEIDASESQFIDCNFENCIFINANLTRVSFIGCRITQSKNSIFFKSTGISQTRFIRSNKNKTYIKNISFHSLGFRNSIFEDVIFENITTDHASFENALFQNCQFDSFSLINSSCRGLILINTSIDHFSSTIEKAISSIGVFENLKKCKTFNLVIDNSNIITSREKLLPFLNENAERFIPNGNLFEYLNILNFLENSGFYNDKNLEKSSFMPLVTDNNCSILYKAGLFAYQNIIDNGSYVTLTNLLLSLKFLFFMDIRDEQLILLIEKIIRNISQATIMDYTNILLVSQLTHYLTKLKSKLKSKKYIVMMRNESSEWINNDSKIEFLSFIDELFKASNSDNYHVKSLHEGSIEAIIELLDPLNLLIICIILGVNLRIESNKIYFSFNPIKGIKAYGEFIKKMASIVPFIGNSNISKRKFDFFKNQITNFLKDYITKNEINGTAEQGNALTLSKEEKSISDS